VNATTLFSPKDKVQGVYILLDNSTDGFQYNEEGTTSLKQQT
jgi:hypothetical protein